MKPHYLLENPVRWCKFTTGTKCDGAPCGAFSPEAVRFCLTAAMARYTGLTLAEQERRIKTTRTWQQWLEDNAKSECPLPPTLENFNDTVEHIGLMAALTEANL
jgi:hypothetical protein